MIQDFAPRFETGKAMLIAGLGDRYTVATNKQIPALWGRWGPAWFGRTPGQIDKKCYGVCWDFDGKGGFDYLAGAEVSSFDAVPDELMTLTIPPHRYAVFPHAGMISAIAETWRGIYEDWQPKSGVTIAAAPCLEIYDEAFDPAQPGHVEIWIPVT